MGVNLKATLPPLLKAKKITQEQLAEKTGMRRTDVNAIVRGRKTVGPVRLKRIADALDVSPVELGAPLEEGDAAGQLLHDRLEALAADVEKDRLRFEHFARATTARLAALEEDQEPPAQQSGHPQ